MLNVICEIYRQAPFATWEHIISLAFKAPISMGFDSFNLEYNLATFCIMKIYFRLHLPAFLNNNDTFFFQAL